jgi:hypothetical protein
MGSDQRTERKVTAVVRYLFVHRMWAGGHCPKLTRAPPRRGQYHDAVADVLEDFADDATYQEPAEFIRTMDEEEQIPFFALAWIGRSTTTEWRRTRGP